MKKITILAIVVALLGSCTQNTEDTINLNTTVDGRTIYATFDNEEGGTKTYVENYKYLRWHAGDEISFFDATTHNNQYAFAGETGDAEGEFNAVATGSGEALATTYGVYPYNANTAISEEGVISVELPATQAYGVNSFGKGANTMVAVGESATDDKLFFKNACGYLVIKLYNEGGAAVKSVVLEGNNEEKIAGAATITATHAGVPSVAMADTATTAVTIDCGEGVEIGTTAETATEFWFALPEITFEGGITITATDTEGKEYEKTTTKPVAITRNAVQPMKALEGEFVDPKPANNEIWYTATGEFSFTYNNFGGAKLISNEWDETTGEGLLIFDGDVTEIGYYVFNSNKLITSVTLPESVMSIGASAFSYCSNLTSINIPNGVFLIDRNAFYNCKTLGDVIIPESVETIGNYAFSECDSFTNITIPNSVISLGSGAFVGCSNLERVVIGEGLTTIQNSTFNGCDKLLSIVIPEGVTTIKSSAFSGCDSLVSVTLPTTLTTLEASVFSNCNSLTTINIPEGVTLLENYLFSYCRSLEKITIPNSVSKIGYSTFENCTLLSSITIPDSVTTIDVRAFYGCAGMTSVTIGTGLASVGYIAFQGCSGLTSVHIKDLVAWCKIEWGGSEFSNPTRYAQHIFVDGEELVELNIPVEITEIKGYAFPYVAIENLTLHDGVTSIGNAAFKDCKHLANVEFGEGLKSVGKEAFYNCSAWMGEITIPDSVETIGDKAFYGCSALEKVVIGKGVTSVGTRAFQNTSKLKEVYCQPSTPPTAGDYVFLSSSSDLVIYVPTESVEEYKAAAGWSVYASDIVGYDFE